MTWPTRFASLALFVAVPTLLAAPPPADSKQSQEARIAKFLERCESSRRGAITQLEYTLRGLRSQTSQTAETQRHIKTIESQLAALRTQKQPVVVPPLGFPPETGEIGRLPQTTCHVDQVLSDQSMLVRCFFPVRVTTVRNYEPRSETIFRPVNLLVQGIATVDTHDGADLDLPGIFEVLGKHTYRSESGTASTAMTIAPFDMAKIETSLKKSSATE